MSLDIDRPPVDESPIKMIGPNQFEWSDNMKLWLTSFYQTLTTFISANGIFLPILTTLQRNALINPQLGQMIYNSDVNAPQIWQGSWKTFTTT